RNPRPETRDPRTENRNPKPETRDPKPETREPRTETRNPKPETRNPRPETRDPKPETQNPKPETRNPNPETRNATAIPKSTVAAASLHTVCTCEQPATPVLRVHTLIPASTSFQADKAHSSGVESQAGRRLAEEHLQQVRSPPPPCGCPAHVD
ncbi:hypothetical protein T484DRAFT_1631098, partial [Baffinella frigidus]